MSRYKMAYASPDEMVFGHSRKPIAYGFGIRTGAGRVIPEINYAPRAGTERSAERLRKEYVDYITRDAIARAVNLGFPDLQLETEWISQMGNDPLMARPIVIEQKEMACRFHSEYDINLAVRHTLPDLRECERGLRTGMDSVKSYPERIFECAETACENGADVLSLESLGGKELTDSAIVRGDIVAFLFGTAILGSIDMEYLWKELVRICRKHRTVPGGDSNCAASNTAMFMAGGMMDNDVQKTFSAICRCISASRTMVAFECGATGPGKDCAYENVIIKAINGMPMSQEGKTCHCAHADLQGNMMAQCADLWSNESVEYHPEFGGSSVGCWTGMLGYECSLMNTSIIMGRSKILRDLYMISDRMRSPESYLLSFNNAWSIGKEIAEHGRDRYMRAKAAAVKGTSLLLEGYGSKEIGLTRKQLEILYKIQRDLETLPDNEEKFIELCLKKYTGDVPTFNPRNYDI